MKINKQIANDHKERPSLFIGSSSEGHELAEAIQQNLDRVCDAAIWSQGIFGLGEGTLEALTSKAPEFDFAVLVVTPDDLTQSRGKRQKTPRDNVLLELGLFIGVLGAERTFVVFDRSSNIKLPTDLAGISLASYHPHKDGNIQAAVGAASSLIRASISKLGLRNKARGDVTQPSLPTTPCELHHVSLPVRNLRRSVTFYRKLLHAEPLKQLKTIGNKTDGRPPFLFSGAWFKLPNGQHIHLIVKRDATFRKHAQIYRTEYRDVHFALRVEDWRATKEFVESKMKLQTTIDETLPTGYPQFYINDPDGHIIEINSRVLLPIVAECRNIA